MVESKIKGSLLRDGQQVCEGSITIEQTRELPEAPVQRDGSFLLKSRPEFDAGATFDLVLEDGAQIPSRNP